jgi:hypothetical protein
MTSNMFGGFAAYITFQLNAMTDAALVHAS